VPLYISGFEVDVKKKMQNGFASGVPKVPYMQKTSGVKIVLRS
jgi:hypothetical protein